MTVDKGHLNNARSGFNSRLDSAVISWYKLFMLGMADLIKNKTAEPKQQSYKMVA